MWSKTLCWYSLGTTRLTSPLISIGLREKHSTGILGSLIISSQISFWSFSKWVQPEIAKEGIKVIIFFKKVLLFIFNFLFDYFIKNSTIIFKKRFISSPALLQSVSLQNQLLFSHQCLL